ncbi:hypothetical protein [Sinomonas mesophila]|nr:hypothetical protein [Sinomonas mesophila]
MTETVEMIDPVTGEVIDQKELAESLLGVGTRAGLEPSGSLPA